MSCVREFLCIFVIGASGLFAQVASAKLIPEILGLKDGERIPDAILMHASVADISESIVERLHRMHEHKPNARPADFLNGAEVHLFFPTESLDGILKDGFLTIQNAARPPRKGEVTTAEAVQRFRDQRIAADSQLSGLDLSRSTNPVINQKLDQIRPKSAYLLLREQRNDLMSFGGYGELIAIPNENLQNRMTWTPLDSYGSPEDYERAFTFRLPEQEMPDAFRYNEAQIWGKFASEDVKEWWVPEGVDELSFKKLQKTGKPISVYVPEMVKGVYFDMEHRARKARPALSWADTFARKSETVAEPRDPRVSTTRIKPNAPETRSFSSNSGERISFTLLERLELGNPDDEFHKVQLQSGSLAVLKLQNMQRDANSVLAIAQEKFISGKSKFRGVPTAEFLDLGAVSGRSAWIKSYVDGVNAFTLMKDKPEDPRLKLLSDPIYQNLNLRSLIWDGKRWVVMDFAEPEAKHKVSAHLRPHCPGGILKELEQTLSRRP